MPTLSIDVEARFAKFQDSLDGIQRDVGRAVGNLEKTFSRLSASFGALVAGAGAGSLAAAFKATVDQLDAFNDASDKTGASVEELSSLLNTLSPYGAGLEDITNVAGVLTKAMRGAEEETSKAAGAFKVLGIETRDAEGNFRPIQDVLEDLAKALDGYADGTNKSALAQDILGKGAAQYMPLLKDLAQAQRASATVTTEQAQAAEKFNVEIGKLTRQLDAFKVSLVGPVLKALNDFIAQLKVGTDAAGGFWSALAKFGLATGSPEANIDRITQRIAELNAQIKKDEALASGEGSAFGRGARTAAENRVKQYRADIDEALKELQYFRLLQEQAGRSTNLRSPALYDAEGVKPGAPRNPDGGAAKNTKAAKDALRDVEDYAAKVRGAVADAINGSDIANARLYADSLAELDRLFFDAGLAAEVYESAVAKLSKLKPVTGADGVGKLNDELDRQASKWKDLVDPARVYVRQLEEIRKLVAEGKLTPDEGMLAEFDVQGKWQDTLDPAKQQVEKLDDAARQLGLTFESAFENAIVNGEKFSKVLASLAQDIARIFVRKAITEPLGNAITGLFGGGVGPELLNSSGPYATKSLSANAVSAAGGVTINQTIGAAPGVSGAELARLGGTVQKNTIVAIREARARGVE